MITTKWHSNQPGTKVFHNNSECENGKIPPYHVILGSGDLQQCEVCNKLENKENRYGILAMGSLIGGAAFNSPFNSIFLGKK